MKSIQKREHEREIQIQFSHQSKPFSQIEGHFDALQHLVDFSGVFENDSVLDVACGPGIVSCECAQSGCSVTGVDITPAMINEAQKKSNELKHANITWVLGDAYNIPFADNTFSLVITRYSFHHLIEPQLVLKEMTRVCKKGGRVVVADVEVEASKSAFYDEVELLRDSSHVHALTAEEFTSIFLESGLKSFETTCYKVELELGKQLKASYTSEENAKKIRELILKDIGTDNLGIAAQKRGGEIVYSVPIKVYKGIK